MKPQVETESTYRRLQRFFAGFAFSYEALGRFLVDLVPSDPPYVAVVDRTEWHFGQATVNVLMIGIAYDGIAFPVAWTALDHGGGSGADQHASVLEQFLRVVEPGQIQALVADREFTGSGFLKELRGQEIPFVIRIKVESRRAVLRGVVLAGPDVCPALRARAVNSSGGILFARTRKLLGVLALTYSWTRLIGLDRKNREGPPRRCANGYPARSLFRYGLDRLRELMLNWHQMQGELNRCIQALITPSLLLSCR